MIRCKTLTGLIVFSLVFSFALASVAKKTPDGQTPAEETVCDGLQGAAFGLCNAFCEAQDCDYLDVLTNSCWHLLENYQKITDFPGPPCVCRDVCIAHRRACIADNIEYCTNPENFRPECVVCPDAIVDGECTVRPLCRQRCLERACAPQFDECIDQCREQYCIQHPDDQRCVQRDCLPEELER